MTYDDLYRAHTDYFGPRAERPLVDCCHHIDKSKPVLDVGAGQGRHSLYLARQGLTVDAIDPSAVGIERLASLASRENLTISAYHVGFEDFSRPRGHYSAVLLFGIIQERSRGSIGLLVDKVRGWLMDGGLVFITAFTTEDPSFERFVNGEKIGKNSFVNARGITRTFMERNEILQLFEGFESVQHWEGLGPLHQHGKNPPERHATVQAVLRKR